MADFDTKRTNDWPLASTESEPPTPEEQYQALISYANSCGLMRRFYDDGIRMSFEHQGVTGNPQLLPEAERHAIVEHFLPEETNIHFTCFHYWLGSLQVVVEGWERLRLSDAEITTLLQHTTNRGLLKRVRHATFHYKPSLRVTNFAQFYQELEVVGPWILQLHEAFGRFFTQHAMRPA
jgi:hypothetical protein